MYFYLWLVWAAEHECVVEEDNADKASGEYSKVSTAFACCWGEKRNTKDGISSKQNSKLHIQELELDI